MTIRLAALAGVVGPVVFFAVVLAGGWVRPGFEPLRQTISDLSRGQGGWVQDANFLVFGLVLLAFSRGLSAAVADSRAKRLGTRLLIGIGLGVLGCGVFGAEPWPLSSMSAAGVLHLISAMVLVFPALPLSTWMMARAFAADERWMSLVRVTKLTATVTALLFVGGLALMSPPGQPQRIGNRYAGLIQRLDVAAFLAWQVTVSRRMGKIEVQRRREREAA